VEQVAEQMQGVPAVMGPIIGHGRAAGCGFKPGSMSTFGVPTPLGHATMNSLCCQPSPGAYVWVKKVGKADVRGGLPSLPLFLPTYGLPRLSAGADCLWPTSAQTAICRPTAPVVYMHSNILEWESFHSKRNGVNSRPLQKKWSGQMFTPKI
jgi:hypothetical protein